MRASGVTGIIPAFNRAALLDRALRSMLGQTLPLDRIIVVDDGSTDGTADMVARHRDRVLYIYQENAGGGAARNRGVREATTPWVAFLDSDDIWLPDHIERISRTIADTSGRGDLYFDDILEEASRAVESRWKRIGFSFQGDFLMQNDAAAWVMMHHQPMMLQTSVIRRDRFLEMGGIWEELRTAHDTHFFLRFGIGRPFCAVAGIGARLTADDVPANRLTVKSGPVKLDRWLNNARLYDDIRRNHKNLDPAFRSILRSRVCEASWRASRIFWQQRNLWESFLQAGRAFRAHPGRMASILLRNLSSGVSK